MAKRLLVPLAAILLLTPVPCGSGEADNAAQAMGFVCRVLSDQNVAVISPLGAAFPSESRIRFLDEQGNTCATGVVRSAYPDLAYVVLDNGSVGCLQKGFIAFTGPIEAQAKFLCGFSRNLPMVIGRNGQPGHKIPPNSIVINYIEQKMKPVSFRHYAHDFTCWTCHHRDLETPCSQCHPPDGGVTLPGENPVKFGDCVRKKCVGCHKGHEGKSADCAWCHK